MSDTQIGSQPLEGIRVLDLGQVYQAPYATFLMAQAGAEVIKVEPLAGDCSRSDGPFPGNEPHPERSARFLYLNTNKRGISLDLRQEEGRALLREPIAQARQQLMDNAGGQIDDRAQYILEEPQGAGGQDSASFRGWGA